MKPQNKRQRQVVEASRSLPRLTDKQIQWGYDNATTHFAWNNSRGTTVCTKCGHSWKEKADTLVAVIEGCDCPNCGRTLTVNRSKGKRFECADYMTVITAHGGYQVVRTVFIEYSVIAGEEPRYTHSEVMQRWIAPDGTYHTFARLRQMMGTCCIDLWLKYTDLELRGESTDNKFHKNTYDAIPTGAVYPRIQLIPELKRTGYKKGLYGQKALDLYRLLLTDSRAETLMKTGYTKLLKRIMDCGWENNIDKYWPSIRIAIRNGYKINDATIWCDYIDYLRFFGRDLHNAKYVCPADLKTEHDRYMLKKQRAEERLETERQLEKEADYRDAKAKFFGLAFTDGHISVRVLESVAEIVSEGRAMHHCVGSYYDKADSLILSATIDGKRIETVEVSISKMTVIQCTGVCNQNSKHHRQILDLVNSKIPVIQQRLAA
jgi:hypothetical protein